MATRLPVELYLASRTGGPGATEQICAQATQRPADGVVAVSVNSSDVARAADLLFGTDVGIVSMIEEPGPGWIDQVRHSVASGATEVALPRLALDDPTTLGRLRSWLGPGTPLTVDLSKVSMGTGVGVAADILRLGADFVSFAPSAAPPLSGRELVELISVASDLGRGGVKIPIASDYHQALVCSETSPAAPVELGSLLEHGMARLRVPAWPSVQ